MSIEARSYYLQTLANEPFSIDFTTVKEAFKEDFDVSFLNYWRVTVRERGVYKVPEAIIITISTVVCDILATLKATFQLILVNPNPNGLKNFIFCVWNLTVADSALALSIFTGVLFPFTRELGATLHKGRLDLPLFDPIETKKQANDKAKLEEEEEMKELDQKKKEQPQQLQTLQPQQVQINQSQQEQTDQSQQIQTNQSQQEQTDQSQQVPTGDDDDSVNSQPSVSQNQSNVSGLPTVVVTDEEDSDSDDDDDDANNGILPVSGADQDFNRLDQIASLK